MARHRQHVDALVGERLRSVRKRRRMTLGDVEVASGGEFRMPPAVAASTDPSLRDAVARWADLGFDPA